MTTRTEIHNNLKKEIEDLIQKRRELEKLDWGLKAKISHLREEARRFRSDYLEPNTCTGKLEFCKKRNKKLQDKLNIMEMRYAKAMSKLKYTYPQIGKILGLNKGSIYKKIKKYEHLTVTHGEWLQHWEENYNELD